MAECFGLVHIGKLTWLDVQAMTRQERTAYGHHLADYQERVAAEIERIKKG